MAEKTNVYLIGFDEASKFALEIYSMKKMRNLRECNVKLNAVFTDDFEKFPGVKKYCLNHQIETINLAPDEEYFISIVHYSIDNMDKKNLAALISENKVFKLNCLLKNDVEFDPHVI